MTSRIARNIVKSVLAKQKNEGDSAKGNIYTFICNRFNNFLY